jgi:hypothetical protein
MAYPDQEGYYAKTNTHSRKQGRRARSLQESKVAWT